MTTSASQLPWLPLAKAAEKVSELTGKHHSKADIIDAALAGHLSLSVHLISPVFARSGHFQDYAEDAPHGISTSVSLLCAENGISSEKSALLELLGIKDGIFAYSSDEGEYVQGLLDLVLIGNGKAHLQKLERKIRGESGGYFLPSGGIYLKGPTGIFWELQEQLDNDSTRSDDHEIEHTPAERFREDWRIVVRPSELEWLLSFHEKPITTTAPIAAPPTTAPTENHLSEGKETMPKRAADYEVYLHDFRDGAVWLLKEEALRLGAGYLPVHDDETMATKLLPPNEQAELNLRTLLGAFNDDRLTIERPLQFNRDGFTYVEAEGFLNWLQRYTEQTRAKEIPSSNEFARAVRIEKTQASLCHSPSNETFDSLIIALDGLFDKPLEEVPAALRQRIEQALTLHLLWDRLTPEQRQVKAAQWDYQNDPATETERRERWNYLSPLFTRLVEAEKKLAKWEATDSKGLPSEEELKESKIKKLQEEIDQINASIEEPAPLVPVPGRHSTDPQALAPPPVAAPPATAPAPGHQAGQKDDRKGGRPPSQLYLGVEALYLKKLRAGQTVLLQPQAGKAFMEELRQAVNGREVCENVVTYIRKLERRGGRYRVYVEDPPEIDGRPPRSNEKPNGYTAADVSKIMNRLRKKYPLE